MQFVLLAGWSLLLAAEVILLASQSKTQATQNLSRTEGGLDNLKGHYFLVWSSKVQIISQPDRVPLTPSLQHLNWAKPASQPAEMPTLKVSRAQGLGPRAGKGCLKQDDPPAPGLVLSRFRRPSVQNPWTRQFCLPWVYLHVSIQASLSRHFSSANASSPSCTICDSEQLHLNIVIEKWLFEMLLG